MTFKPLTREYCVKKIMEAVKAGDLKGIEKWQSLLKSENEFIFRVKLRERERREDLMRIALRESYRL